MAKYTDLATDILDKIGGKENVKRNQLRCSGALGALRIADVAK